MIQGKNQIKALITICLAMFTVGAAADVLYLQSGQKQEGVIVPSKTNASMVTIRTTSGEISIPRAKISRTESETATQSWTRLGDAYAAQNDFEKAIETYKQAIGQDANNQQAQDKLAKAQQSLASKSAGVKQQVDARGQRAIDQAVGLANAKRFEEAANLLKSVEPDPSSPVYPAYAKALGQVEYLWGVDRMDKQDTAGAAEKFKLVLQLDPDNQQARDRLVKTFAGDPTKLNQMADYYLQSKDPADQLKGAEALYKLQDYGKALPIYLKYASDPQYGTDQIRERMRTMLDSLQQQSAQKGDYKTALAYYGQLLQLKPDADPSPYFKYEYMVRRADTNMTDPASRLALAQYAEKLGLLPTAKEEYVNVLAMDPKNTGATEALKRYAQADLQDAKDFMTAGQFQLAVQKAQEVTKSYGRFEDIAQAAQQLQAQAQIEAQKQAKSTAQQAIALAQRGDDYFNQAMAYFGSYASTQTNPNVRIYNPRDEAAKYFRQAIFAWQTALQMDSSLGSPTTYNLTFKIADATAKYAAISNRQPPAMPTRDTTVHYSGSNTLNVTR